LAVSAASAHHPFSITYDAAKFGTLAGKVVKVQWTNPHVVLALDVERPDGKTERWLIEGYPPNTLGRQGWEQDSLREGTPITVSGWHARDETLKIFHGREVTFEKGSKRLFGTTPEEGDRWRCGSGDCFPWIPSIAE
jgi:hypothetical protein